MSPATAGAFDIRNRAGRRDGMCMNVRWSHQQILNFLVVAVNQSYEVGGQDDELYVGRLLQDGTNEMEPPELSMRHSRTALLHSYITSDPSSSGTTKYSLPGSVAQLPGRAQPLRRKGG